jgi:hypothetical protein
MNDCIMHRAIKTAQGESGFFFERGPATTAGVNKWSSGGKVSRLAQAMYVYNDCRELLTSGKWRLHGIPKYGD